MTEPIGDQQERRQFLIQYLLQEDAQYEAIAVPPTEAEQKRLLRALLNVRPPRPADAAFLRVQDAYLTQAAREKGIVQPADFAPVQPGIFLWRGDITRLAADAIVNAANSGMTGCYVPNHSCIDNCIHTYAGVQLRLACAQHMRAQGHEEPPGRALLTPGFNLPARFVLHTVGPIVDGAVTEKDEALLAACYRACLTLAQAHHLRSVAFCCISTGVFHFPHRRAAEIAVQTVREFFAAHPQEIGVLFNVFTEEDDAIYRALLR